MTNEEKEFAEFSAQKGLQPWSDDNYDAWMAWLERGRRDREEIDLLKNRIFELEADIDVANHGGL